MSRTSTKLVALRMVLAALLVPLGFAGVGAAYLDEKTARQEAVVDRAEAQARAQIEQALRVLYTRDTPLADDHPDRSVWVVSAGASLPPVVALSPEVDLQTTDGRYFHRAAHRAARAVSPAPGRLEPVEVDGQSFVVEGGEGFETVMRTGVLTSALRAAARPLGFGTVTIESGDTLGEVAARSASMAARRVKVPRVGPEFSALFFPPLGSLFLTMMIIGDLRALARRWGRRREEQSVQAEVLERMSHDLRTPAAAVQSLVEALQSDAVADPAERDELLALARLEAERLSQGIRTLLRAARGEQQITCSPVVVDLSEWAQATTRRWKARLPGLQVSAPPSCTGRVDPERLDEAVDALLDNARRHGGSAIQLEVGADGRWVEVAVKDDGPGVLWWKRRSILKKHVRGTDEPGGTGLGLWVVGEIARAHGGSLTLDGRSRFVMRLPR